MKQNDVFYVRGNHTKIEDLPSIIHPYATLPIVQPDKTITTGDVPLANIEHVIRAKKFVDRNHK